LGIMSSEENKELHIETEIKVKNKKYLETEKQWTEEVWDVDSPLKPAKCYRWEFNHVGNNLDKSGNWLENPWEKLSIHLNFILDYLEANDGPKAYRYISKGGRGYIADIENMTLVRLGTDDVAIKAWKMRKILLNPEETITRRELNKYQTEVYSSSNLEVTEICTKRQRFDIKGYINIFWKATELNKEDIKDENLEELAGKTYCKIKKLKDRKLNIPISLSNPIRNAVHVKFSSSATYYRAQKVIHLVIKIESAILHEDMHLETYPFDRQFLNVCLSCRRSVSYKLMSVDDNSKFKKKETGLFLADEPARREVQKSFFTTRSLEMKHSGWVWTAECPNWLPVSSHYHLVKIPVHTKLQGSVADEWKMMRPWCDYAWGLFSNTYFIRIRIERQSTYHLSHTTAPLFMIVCAAFGAFFVPIDNAAERLSVSLTAMLTAVAFQFNVASQLPDAGYSTAIDKYILFAFFTLFVVIIENMFMSSIALEDWDNHEDIDKILGFFMCGLWVAYNIFFCINTFSWRRIDWNELSKMELARAGSQLLTAPPKNCKEVRHWGVVENCEDIHPQGVCVDRTELIEETKQKSKVLYHRQEEIHAT